MSRSFTHPICSKGKHSPATPFPIRYTKTGEKNNERRNVHIVAAFYHKITTRLHVS